MLSIAICSFSVGERRIISPNAGAIVKVISLPDATQVTVPSFAIASIFVSLILTCNVSNILILLFS
jgi:hypothetical protein